jgi:SAM-dependent methyltransferase
MSQIEDWLDGLLADGLQTYVENNKDQLTTPASLKKAQSDLSKLSRGEDPLYDTPATGAVYGLTYHSIRMNDGMRSLIPALKDRLREGRNPPAISLIDLGCGTGVGLWALTAILEGARQGWVEDLEGIGMPGQIHYLGLDSSPFMIDAAKDLWEKCGSHLSPKIPVSTNFRICNWPIAPSVLPKEKGFEKPWLMASFLFDFDMANEEPGTGDMKKSFTSATRYFQPDFVFLLCTARKKKCTDEITEEVRKIKIKHAPGKFRKCEPPVCSPLKGNLGQTTLLRRKVLGDFLNLKWDPPHPTHIHVLEWWGDRFISPEIAMQGIVLDLKQEQAADLKTLREPGGSPRRIKGPPGSGKTVILYKLLIKLLKEATSRSEPVLFVTFNLGVIEQIHEWSRSVLFKKEAEMEELEWRIMSDYGGHFEIFKDGRVQARLMNLDKLPTQIGRLTRPEGPGFDIELKSRVRSAGQEIRNLEEGKLVSEFRVHFYGKAEMSYEKYLEIERNKSTGLRLARGTKIRKEVGSLFQGIRDPYLKNRICLLEKLRKQQIPRQFRCFLVDELQDMTDADLEILRHLALPGATLAAAEDARQCIHTGPFYRAPALFGNRCWNDMKVSTCYRTPYRIALTLQKISEELAQKPKEEDEGREEHIEPVPTRLSFTGIRPILIQGGHLEGVAKAIRSIVRNILEDSVAASARGLILETNNDLCRALNACQDTFIKWETKSILKAKGLESPVLVWDTGRPLPSGCKLSFAYTIISRATSICIIWERPETAKEIRELLASMVDKEILKWPNLV